MSEILTDTITRVVGEDWPIRITIRNRSTGAVIDLAAYTANFGMKTNRDDAEAAVIGSTVCTTDSSGNIDVTIADTTTAAIAAGTYWGEIERITGSTKRKTQFKIIVVGRVIE